jgi:hypothetical protein
MQYIGAADVAERLFVDCAIRWVFIDAVEEPVFPTRTTRFVARRTSVRYTNAQVMGTSRRSDAGL